MPSPTRPPTPRRTLLALAAIHLALLPLPLCPAQPPPAPPLAPALQQAERALADGQPAIALPALRLFLDQSQAQGQERQAALLLLAEAQVRGDHPDDALATLDEPALASAPETPYWRAQALATLERWPQALDAYETARATGPGSVPPDDLTAGWATALEKTRLPDTAAEAWATLRDSPAWGNTARLRRTEILLELDRPADALAELDSLRPVSPLERKTAACLEARAQLATGKPAEAARLCQSMIATVEGEPSPEGLTPALRASAHFLQADAFLAQKSPERAEATLAEFLKNNPSSPFAPEGFSRLARLYLDSGLSPNSTLGAWADAPTGDPLRALALLNLAQVELHRSRPDPARAALETLCREERSDLPLLATAAITLAQLHLQENHPALALALADDIARLPGLPPPALARLHYLAASALFAQGNFPAAANRFRQAAQTGDDLDSQATFASALSWLEAGQPVPFNDAARKMALSVATDPAAADTRRQLLLSGALALARRTPPDKDARPALEAYLQEFPTQPGATEVRLTLAEMSLVQDNPADSQRYLQLVRSDPDAPETLRQRADSLEIWLADSAPDRPPAPVVELARKYLETWRQPPDAAEIRFKLATLLLETSDPATAAAEFSRVARQPGADPALAEMALLQSARASERLDDPKQRRAALDTYQTIVQRKGPLRRTARLAQATLLRNLAQETDALAIYEDLLAEPDIDPATRLAALSGKAQTLFTLGADNPENYRKSLAIGDTLLAATPPPDLRRQTLYRQAQSWLKLKQPDPAILALDTALNTPDPPGAPPADTLWTEKSGIELALLLEERGEIPTAISVLKKLSELQGPRAPEARERLNALRLKNFIWD